MTPIWFSRIMLTATHMGARPVQRAARVGTGYPECLVPVQSRSSQ